MTTTQIAWIAGIVFISLGLLAVNAIRRSSQLSASLRRSGQEQARLRAKLSKGSIMEALRVK